MTLAHRDLLRLLHIAGLALLAAGLLAETRPPAAPVILISIDTLRADHLSAYGYRKAKTPNIDAFLQNGTAYANATAQIPLTLPSHTTLLTSTYPFANGTEENAEKVSSGAVTLASVLRAHGYRTAAFIGSVFLERQLGLDAGFDVYDSPFNFAAFSPRSGEMLFGGYGMNAYQVRESRGGALVLRAATQWLTQNATQPAFAFVHLFDLHQPYRVPEEVARQEGLSRYDAELQAIDAMLGRFRQFLMRSGIWDRALVIVVSDHGEGLGDHGEFTHGYFIYQSTIWVPLLVHWPAGTPLPRQTEQPLGLIDVAPGILDFLQIAPPPSFQGHSFLASASPGVYSESVYAHDAFHWASLRSLRQGDWKYIAAPRPELYNLRDDPQERHNLIRANPAKAADLRAQLSTLLARYAPKRSKPAHDASPGTQALLNSLGYLSSGPHVPLTSSGPDPKDRLAEYQLYEDALDAGYHGRTDAAISALRRIVARDPQNVLAARDLGECYIQVHDYSKARALFTGVVAASPTDYLSHLGLGLADEHLGKLPEALAQLNAACRIAPEAEQCRHELAALRQKMK